MTPIPLKNQHVPSPAVAPNLSRALPSRFMSLASRFFAATYDLMLARVEKAGWEAHRRTRC